MTATYPERLGLATYVSPANAVADVVLLHGEMAGAVRTWLAPGDDFWPASMLKNALPTVAIHAYGYDAANWRNAANGAGFTLRQRAADLRQALKLKGVGTVRPVVLVAHSVGGLVAKQALDSARDDHDALATLVAGVVFFDTPHRGARAGTVPAGFVAGAGARTPLPAFLALDSDDLVDLNQRFLGLHKPSRSLVAGVESPTTDPLLVARASAQLGAPAPHMDVVCDGKTHRTITQPMGLGDVVFTATVAFLRDQLGLSSQYNP